jgi:hypothetical protein
MRKKLILWMGLIIMGFSVIAQENTELQTNSKEKKEFKSCCKKDKTDKQLLPEQGNWAIGIDAVPLLRTLGTVFWGGNNPMGFQGTPYFTGGNIYPNVSVMAKYMAKSNCAIRVNLGVNISSNTMQDRVRDDAAFFIDNNTVAKVTDQIKTNAYGLSLAVGAEYRHGNRRVVGVFGGDLLFGYYAGSVKYSYGNIMNADNQRPTTNQPYFASPISDNARALFQKNNGAFSIGAQVSAGLEVFVAPKIALGGQVNLSYVFMYNNKIYREAEGYNELSGKVEKITDIQTPAGWSHKFNTNNLGGSLYMIFYF